MLSLTSRWFLAPGREGAADQALRALATSVEAGEPDTLAYLVHRPFEGDARVQSLPPGSPHSVVFFECYRDIDAFLAHLHGPIFEAFVRDHGALWTFCAGPPGSSGPRRAETTKGRKAMALAPRRPRIATPPSCSSSSRGTKLL
jgi:quinol monooxygenase YgiN